MNVEGLNPERFWLATFLTVAMAGVGALADYFLKRASLDVNSMGNRWFVSGAVVHGMTAFGWVWIMKHLKLAALGVVYSLSTVVLLTLVGWGFFEETLSVREWLGLILAVISLLLLSRFS